MPSRRQLLFAAGGGSLLSLAGRTLRAAAADPLAPWAAAPSATHPDPRIRAAGWAVLAPNPHNRQPWLVELTGTDSLLLHCDLDRRLPVTDPLDRQITIGLGCFAELFRMAAAAAGLAARIEPFPEGEPAPRLDARPVARITLGPGGVPDPLFAGAAARRSAKRPFDMARPVTAGRSRASRPPSRHPSASARRRRRRPSRRCATLPGRPGRWRRRRRPRMARASR